MKDDQKTLWNPAAGCPWVELQELVDRAFRPMESLLVEAVPPGSDSHVLDVGCGTGGTTVAAARRLGAGGRALGVDISEPMLDAARARAKREGSIATFISADVQHYAFEAASFDVILSRFGVMFFEDSVQAFANLRRAARDDAELRFIAWRGPEDNPFMTTAERAAAPLVPSMPPRQLDAPGQFAFADAQRVRRILEDSGWMAVDISPVDIACTFPESELVSYCTRFGPLGRVLHQVDERLHAQIITTVRRAFDPFVRGAEVHFNAACWRVVARAPAGTPRSK
jgi:SAM-dependent methyltransferase